MYMYTYINAYILIHMYIYIHADMFIFHMCIRTYIDTYINLHINMIYIYLILPMSKSKSISIYISTSLSSLSISLYIHIYIYTYIYVHITPKRPAKETYTRNVYWLSPAYLTWRNAKRDLQKRPAKETCKRDLQKRPTKETCKRDLHKRCILTLTRAPQMETYEGDLQKRPAKETYKRDLQKRPTKEMYTDSHPRTSDGATRGDVAAWKETYIRNLRKRPTKETYKKDLQKRCILTLTRMPQMAQREETLQLESAAREHAEGRQRQIVESSVLTLQADLLEVQVWRFFFNQFFFLICNTLQHGMGVDAGVIGVDIAGWLTPSVGVKIYFIFYFFFFNLFDWSKAAWEKAEGWG